MSVRVLHVCHSTYPDSTGASVRSRYLVATQARLGVDALVVSSPFQRAADPANAHGVERVDGVEYYRCFEPRYDQRFIVARKSIWTRVRKLTAIRAFTSFVLRIAREQHVDVIHGHSLFFCGLAAVLAARASGIPSVYEVRSLIEDTLVREGGTSERGLLYHAYRWFDQLTVRLADHVVAISDGLRTDLVSRGVPPSRITVVGNGVDIQKQRPAPEADPVLRASLGLPADAFVLGYIGTLFNYESLDVAIEAVAQMRASYPKLRLLIVGDGAAREQLAAQVARLELTREVQFVNRVPHDDIGQYYGLVDLFVLPRRPNRLTDLVTPLKPLEIMARAKPLLASDCGGHKEIVIHGVNGLLFEARSPTGLADVVASLHGHSDILRDLGVRARRWVAANRSWESAVRPTLPLYESLVRAKAAARAEPSNKSQTSAGKEA